MREQALFHTHQKHQRELKPLDRVHGHQLHAILPGVTLGLARLKRRVREEGVQHGHVFLDLRVVGEALASADQFLQVFDARLPFFAGVFLEMGVEAAHLDAGFDLLAERQFAQFGRHATDQIDISLQGAAGTRRQLLRAQQFQARIPQRGRPNARMRSNFIDGLLPDAARRVIDGALKSIVRARARNHAQVGERILDLGAFEEAQAAVNPVRHATSHQRFLELP